MLPDVNQIWNWVVKRFVSLNVSNHQTVSKSNARPYTNIQYYKTQNEFGFTRLDNNNTPVSYPNGTYCTITDTDIQTCWDNICKNESLDSKLRNAQKIGRKNSSISTVTMWLLGDGSYDGLVFWEHATQQYHLRYIPVDFNLFDSIMAELNLRRSKNSSEDDTLAIYEPSDWIQETPTGTWRVHAKKDATGYTISIKNKGETTTIDLTQNAMVKQFAEYDWSTANANTLAGEAEPRFYVSWPEKMLLQEFLKRKVEDVEHIQYISTVPHVWWGMQPDSFTRSTYYGDETLTAAQGFCGLGFGLTNLSLQQTFEEMLVQLEVAHSSEYKSKIRPFLLLMRPNDRFVLCKGNAPIWLGNISTNPFSNYRELPPKSRLSKHIMRSIDWDPSITTTKASLSQDQSIEYGVDFLQQHQTDLNIPSVQTCYTLTRLNHQNQFVTAYKSATIKYYDFIEQRAKVLDPTSRALLVYLKYNTPNTEDSIDTDLDEDNIEMETPNTEPTKLIRPADKIPSSELSQKLLLSKNLILEGVPGTGKTFGFKKSIVEVWEQEVGRKVGSKNEAITMHPSTSYEDFLEGLRPKTVLQSKPKTNIGQLNIELKNNRFIVDETEELLYIEDRTDSTIRVATVPKRLLKAFLNHASAQDWDHNYNQAVARKSFEEHTTWNVWPLTDGATFHGVAKYYLEHNRTVESPLRSSKATTIKIGHFSIDTADWFTQPPKDVQGNFSVQDGFFLNVCKKAVQNPSKDYLVLLDEINRCNIPSVFGDLLTAIERSKRATWDNDKQCWNLSNAQTITLAISKRQFFVPENVYVVGTMNTTDRSVAPMDMALRRRFAFHRIEPVAPKKQNFTEKNNFPKIGTYWDNLHKSIQAIEALNTNLENWGKDALLGYSYIYDLAADLERYGNHQNQLIEHHWNHHILPQLGDIIFSNQIVEQKLENLLQNCVTDDKHSFTIANKSINTEQGFERPHLFFAPKTSPKENNPAPDERNDETASADEE